MGYDAGGNQLPFPPAYGGPPFLAQFYRSQTLVPPATVTPPFDFVVNLNGDN
jgi:hypothetical protein